MAARHQQLNSPQNLFRPLETFKTGISTMSTSFYGAVFTCWMREGNRKNRVFHWLWFQPNNAFICLLVLMICWVLDPHPLWCKLKVVYALVWLCIVCFNCSANTRRTSLGTMFAYMCFCRLKSEIMIILKFQHKIELLWHLVNSIIYLLTCVLRS